MISPTVVPSTCARLSVEVAESHVTLEIADISNNAILSTWPYWLIFIDGTFDAVPKKPALASKPGFLVCDILTTGVLPLSVVLIVKLKVALSNATLCTPATGLLSIFSIKPLVSTVITAALDNLPAVPIWPYFPATIACAGTLLKFWVVSVVILLESTDNFWNIPEKANVVPTLIFNCVAVISVAVNFVICAESADNAGVVNVAGFSVFVVRLVILPESTFKEVRVKFDAVSVVKLAESAWRLSNLPESKLRCTPVKKSILEESNFVFVFLPLVMKKEWIV